MRYVKRKTFLLTEDQAKILERLVARKVFYNTQEAVRKAVDLLGAQYAVV